MSAVRAKVAALLLPLLLGQIDLGPREARAEGAIGTRGAVAAEHRLASAAGVEILRAGGNAVDATVAAILATGVVNPASSGLGGGGFMLIFLAGPGQAHAIDFRETAPGAATREMYASDAVPNGKASTNGGLAVAVPGEVAGLVLALERFGTSSLARVAAPAIRLARDGFPVERHLADALERMRSELAADPALAAEFLHPDGTPYRAGETLVRAHLADTLDTLARDGAAAFYRGPIARDIVRTVRDHGGILSEEDLETYQALEREVVSVQYKDWRVLGMPPPSSGGAMIGATLAVLEPYRLGELGRRSATYMHLVAEVYKAAFADRAFLYGDPGYVAVPLDRLLSPGHAAAIRANLRASRVVPAASYGNTDAALDAGTSHVSTVDEAGNAAACTSSINTSFGSKLGVVERGIVLNNTMDDFSLRPGVPNAYGLVGSQANSIAAGKRPLSSMSPTIVLEDGRVRLVVGASGGPLIITATMETLLNVLEFSMDVQAAIDEPRFHNQWMPDVLTVEAAVPEPVRASLSRLGHHLADMRQAAAVQAVEVSPGVGQRRVQAESDDRKGGVAMSQ